MSSRQTASVIVEAEKTNICGHCLAGKTLRNIGCVVFPAHCTCKFDTARKRSRMGLPRKSREPPRMTGGSPIIPPDVNLEPHRAFGPITNIDDLLHCSESQSSGEAGPCMAPDDDLAVTSLHGKSANAASCALENSLRQQKIEITRFFASTSRSLAHSGHCSTFPLAVASCQRRLFGGGAPVPGLPALNGNFGGRGNSKSYSRPAHIYDVDRDTQLGQNNPLAGFSR